MIPTCVTDCTAQAVGTAPAGEHTTATAFAGAQLWLLAATALLSTALALYLLTRPGTRRTGGRNPR